MPFLRPSLTSLQQQAAADITSADLPTLTGSLLPKAVLRVLADAQAGLAWLHYGYLDWIARQSVPFTASDEYLEAWAALKGVLRKPAQAATGAITFTGTNASIVPAGSVVQRADGAQYTTDADIPISGTTGTGAITAVTAGALGNAVSGISLSLTTTVSGITSAANASSDLTGGADIETSDSLRTRMLEVYANPPMGGAASDYVEWALAVPGVTRAWTNGNGAGPGTVVVYTMWDVSESIHGGFPQGTDGVATAETRGAAATGEQLIVANYIYPLRPVTALVYSVAPQSQAVNLTIHSLIPSTVAIRAAISDAITALFLRIGSPLAMTLYQSDISAAILAVAGVQEFELIVPTETAITLGHLPVLGSITYT